MAEPVFLSLILGIALTTCITMGVLSWFFNSFKWYLVGMVGTATTGIFFLVSLLAFAVK